MNAAKSARAVTLFYCYAHEDEALLKTLEKHLTPLKRLGYLTDWHNRQIEAGMEWQQEIERHLSNANIILLLLSPDFVHSDGCNDEMRQAMALHTAGRARVIPILLRPVLWEGTPLSQLEGLPENGKPVTTWENQDQAFHQIVYHLTNIVRKQLNFPPLEIQAWQDSWSLPSPEILAPSPLLITDSSSVSHSPITVAENPSIQKRKIPMSSAFSRLQDDLKLGLTCIKDVWNFETKDWVTGVHAADINQDGDIEVLLGSRDGRTYSLTRDGRLRWMNIVGNKSEVTAIVAYAPSFEHQDACVITSDHNGRIYVLDQNGQQIAPPGSDALEPTYWLDMQQPITLMGMDTSLPLTVVFATTGHYVCSFDVAHNRLRWRFSTGDQIRALFTCDVDGDGRAETLIGSGDQMLYMLSSSGELLHSCQLEQAVYALFADDIDNDGKIEILVGTRTKKLFALTTDLQEKWSQTLSNRPLAISVVDVNNDRLPEILVACDDQSLSILDNEGKLIWHQNLGKRYQSLSTFDLDLDGYVEILAGADNSHIYAFRIQLSKDLSKKIRRDYIALGKPDITTLLDLTREQLDLLLSVLGITSTLDKKLTLASAKTQMEAGDVTDALLSLLKLDQQRFQLLWEKDQMGYRRALCLADLSGDKRRAIVVSSLDGGITVFNAKGRLLWSELSPDRERIFDVQSGYLSSEHGEDLVFASDAGVLSILKPEKTRSTIPLSLSEPASCFYLLDSGFQSTSELLIGTESGKAYLYSINNFEMPVRVFDLSVPVWRVYASDPDEGAKYQNPELLICTSDNRLCAYTRGGNCLWVYQLHGRILALCVRDLDGDGHLEVLVGTEDRNVHILDDNGMLRWRYILHDNVLALEVADLDDDGQQELLVGCADGILSVFTPSGDLIWRYITKDCIQTLRVADIDLDGNLEIVMAEEGHLEVLQIVNQKHLKDLFAQCWGYLLTEHDPLDALLPLIKGNDPHLRAAGLLKLATLDPLPPETLDLLSEATNDVFADVRKVLPEALMRAYPGDITRARILLNALFADRLREVRIEVIEHLEILAHHDWNMALSYLERALASDERHTRRAALRKISYLLKNRADEIKNARETLGEAFFRLLLTSAQDNRSTWIRQETGRVLANFLNLFEEEFLLYLYRLFANRPQYYTLEHTAYNLTASAIQRTVFSLLALKFNFSQENARAALLEATHALEHLHKQRYMYSTDLWLLFRELLKLSQLSSLEELATYDFQLKPEQFKITDVSYPYTQQFLLLGDHLNMMTRPLKTYMRRTDPDDRLNSLLDSIGALEAFQRLLDREYGVSPLPSAPEPYQPEFGVLRVLSTHWQELFSAQRKTLRGHPDLKCDIQPRTVHLEETVGFWLQITNLGRAPARKVRVTLLSNKSFATDRFSPHQLNEIDDILPSQEVSVEFSIKPVTDSVTLTFEIAYDDAEHESLTFFYQERLDFIEHHQTFTPIHNPYTTGTPLHDRRMFYGREVTLAYLHDNLTRPATQTVLVLYGQRRSGKTTLLNQLTYTSLLGQHIPVLIDLQGLAYELTIGKLLFRIAYRIYQAMTQKGFSVPQPERMNFIGQTNVTPDPTFAFDCFLDDIKAILKEQKLILMFDEFEVLEEQVHKGKLQPEIFLYLRSLIQERHYMHFLLSGTHHIEQLTRNYWSVFFNIALHHRLPGRISPDGAEALITEPMLGFLEYDPMAVKKIRLLTADQPYLLHLVCRSLVDHCNKMRKNYATINDVNLVLSEVIATGTIHFDWIWNQIEPPEQLLLQVIAEGSKEGGRPVSLEDISMMYRHYGLPYHHEEVAASLKALWAEDVIEQTEELFGTFSNSSRYHVAIGLLRAWLRHEKPLKKFIEPL